jgi:hypothetical protein
VPARARAATETPPLPPTPTPPWRGARPQGAYFSFPRLVYTVYTCYTLGMPKIILNVSEEQKALWVDQAFEDRVSLSEWIRRRCDGGLDGREVAPRREGSSGFESQSASRPSSPRPFPPAPSGRSFRPDPKGKK